MSSLQDSRLKLSSILSHPYGVSLSLLSAMGLVSSSSPQLLCYFNHTVLEIKRDSLSTTDQVNHWCSPSSLWQPIAHIHVRQQVEDTVNSSAFQKPTKTFLTLVFRRESNRRGVMNWQCQQTFQYHTGIARCREKGLLYNPIHQHWTWNPEVKLQRQPARASMSLTMKLQPKATKFLKLVILKRSKDDNTTRSRVFQIRTFYHCAVKLTNQ